eukprot:scaffold109630_cov67-Cyclotella_meneghiniana.AAC.4
MHDRFTRKSFSYNRSSKSALMNDKAGILIESSSEGIVEVVVKRTLPGISPSEARKAWIDYHWTRGGGLPILVQSTNATSDNDNGALLKRTIYPVIMEETLQLHPCDEDASYTELGYRVSESGPFYRDVIDGSHYANVTFTSVKSGCEMIWNVSFAATRWAEFYKVMTEFLVGTCANTVEETLAPPRVFRMSTTIDDCIMDAKSARNEWFEFIWRQGGGLPLPPAIPYGDTLEGSTARKNLLRIPPLITESITDISDDDNTSEFEYRLNSPGWLTFPFLMHTHRGVVKFTSNSDNSLSIHWDVEIRPYRVAGPLVEKITEMTVSTLLRNLRVKLKEPGATVTIKPPRGNTDLLAGQENLGSIGKETWLGGVLYAHLSDNRSTLQQSVAMLQPWTWGRSGDGAYDDVVQFQWSNYLS